MVEASFLMRKPTVRPIRFENTFRKTIRISDSLFTKDVSSLDETVSQDLHSAQEEEKETIYGSWYSLELFTVK